MLDQAVDVTDASAVHGFVEAVINKFGSVDICVTNAGGPPAKGFMAASLEDWRKAVDANFLSAVYFAREVIPHMQRKHWGRIITITSITTKQPVTDLVLSNAVRTSVVGLVKSLANEFGKDGILVNNVGPGFTATDRLKQLAKDAADASHGQVIPLAADLETAAGRAQVTALLTRGGPWVLVNNAGYGTRGRAIDYTLRGAP